MDAESQKIILKAMGHLLIGEKQQKVHAFKYGGRLFSYL